MYYSTSIFECCKNKKQTHKTFDFISTFSGLRYVLIKKTNQIWMEIFFIFKDIMTIVWDGQKKTLIFKSSTEFEWKSFFF